MLLDLLLYAFLLFKLSFLELLNLVGLFYRFALLHLQVVLHIANRGGEDDDDVDDGHEADQHYHAVAQRHSSYDLRQTAECHQEEERYVEDDLIEDMLLVHYVVLPWLLLDDEGDVHEHCEL